MLSEYIPRREDFNPIVELDGGRFLAGQPLVQDPERVEDFVALLDESMPAEYHDPDDGEGKDEAHGHDHHDQAVSSVHVVTSGQVTNGSKGLADGRGKDVGLLGSGVAERIVGEILDHLCLVHVRAEEYSISQKVCVVQKIFFQLAFAVADRDVRELHVVEGSEEGPAGRVHEVNAIEVHTEKGKRLLVASNVSALFCHSSHTVLSGHKARSTNEENTQCRQCTKYVVVYLEDSFQP